MRALPVVLRSMISVSSCVLAGLQRLAGENALEQAGHRHRAWPCHAGRLSNSAFGLSPFSSRFGSALSPAASASGNGPGGEMEEIADQPRRVAVDAQALDALPAHPGRRRGGPAGKLRQHIGRSIVADGQHQLEQILDRDADPRMAEGRGEAFGFDHHSRIDRHQLIERQSRRCRPCDRIAPATATLNVLAIGNALVGVDQNSRAAAVEPPGGDADRPVDRLTNARDFGLQPASGRRQRRRSRSARTQAP